MGKLLAAFIIGVIAGIIDIVPMIFQKLDKFSIVSAFVQWIVVAFVITHIHFGVEGWLKGFIVAIMMALPIVILVLKTDSKSVLPILAMSAVLGSLVGFVIERYIE